MRRPLAVLALAFLTACSSSSHPKDVAAPGTSSAPTSSTAPSTTTTPGASPSTGGSGVPAGSGGSGTSAAPATGGSNAPQATTSASAASKATAAGTYTYDSSGSQTISGAKQAVSSTATLTVSKLVDGSQTSKLHNSQGDTDQALAVRENGSYLGGLTISSPTANVEFRFAPPVLLLPDPAKPGATWSWSGTSTDASTTVQATNKVLRTETVTIGGEPVATVVLQTHLVLTGKNLSYTADATNWVAPAYRLPVKTHTVGKGSYGAFPFSFDVTDVLRSVRPA
jgi:hypothetical protein